MTSDELGRLSGADLRREGAGKPALDRTDIDAELASRAWCSEHGRAGETAIASRTQVRAADAGTCKDVTRRSAEWQKLGNIHAAQYERGFADGIDLLGTQKTTGSFALALRDSAFLVVAHSEHAQRHSTQRRARRRPEMAWQPRRSGPGGGRSYRGVRPAQRYSRSG